jgi:uncharacterized protein YqhQ
MARVGGQAVVNGVLLRGEYRWAVAVRRPDGVIAVLDGALPGWLHRARRVPVLRGLVAVATALPTGLRAMAWAAGQSGTRRGPASVLRLLGLLGALLVLPPVLTDRLVAGDGWPAVVVANAVTVVVVVAYARLVRRGAVVTSLLEYHGAEHKVIAAHEAGAPPTPEAAVSFSTRHPRCGTSLLLPVAVVAAVVSVLRLPSFVVLPVVVGLAAELQIRAAANTHRRFVRRLLAPGLALQRLTTREPSPAQLEVALAALQAVTARAAQPSDVVTEAAAA